MSDESTQDIRMKELWQSQKTEGVRMSIEQIQASAGKLQRKIEFRNVREYVAAFVVVVFFALEFSRAADLLVRTGFALIIAGTCYLVWQLHSKGSWRPLPRDAGLSSCIEFKRRELVRQRDLVSSVWCWYLGPLIPGMAVLIVAFWRANPGHVKHMGMIAFGYAALVAAVFLAIAKLNKNAARKLQQQIDELDEGGR
ncbi:MAG: hypothetical protein ACLPY1_24865 [Terracidiphilus sp.]